MQSGAVDSPVMVFVDESFMPRSLRLRINERYLRPRCHHLLARPMRETTDGGAGQLLSIVKNTPSPSSGDDTSLYNNVVNSYPCIVPDGEFLYKYLELIEKTDFIPQSTVLLLLQSSISTAIASGLTRHQTRRLVKLVKSLPSAEVYCDIFDEGLANCTGGNDLRADATSRHPIILAAQRSWMGRGGNASSRPITILTENPTEYVQLQDSNHRNEGFCVEALTAMEFVKRSAPHLTEACEQLIMSNSRLLCSTQIKSDTAISTWDANNVGMGLNTGQLLRGTLDVFRHCPSEGTINEGEVFIASLGLAVHRDVVAVELLPKQDWRCPSGRTHLTYASPAENDSDDEREEDKKEVSEMLKCEKLASNGSNSVTVRPTGRVVAVLQRSGEDILATIPPFSDGNGKAPCTTSQGGQHRVLAIPMDRHIPKIYLSTRQLALLEGQRLVVRVDGWESGSRYPHGHYVRCLGAVGDLSSEIKGLLVGQEIVLRPFSPAALACLPHNLLHLGNRRGDGMRDEKKREIEPQDLGFRAAAPTWIDSKWVPSPEDLVGRRDLRDSSKYLIFSVDPRGCQDIDDAMHVRWLSHGEGGGGQCHDDFKHCRKLEIGVHIADVSWFVSPGSALDIEARSKGTSVYLPHRKFDMLPPLLSADVCSLQGGKVRLAVSAIFTLDEEKDGTFSFPVNDDGSLICWFGRTVIRSACALTYEQAAGLMATNGTDITAGGAPAPPGQAGGPLPSNLAERQALARDLSLLSSVARSRRAWRVKRGASASFHSVATKSEDAMDGDGGELKFKLDENTGKPLAVCAVQRKEIHTVIEELMVLSNQAAAETLISKCPSTALVRVHEPPVGDMSELFALSEGLGFAKGGGTSVEDKGQEIHAAMKAITRTKKPLMSAFAKSLAFRAMSEAKYTCSGGGTSSLTENSRSRRFEHYGLALPAYTHFTSPIRRYVDLEVHRLLLHIAPQPIMQQQQPEVGGPLATLHYPLSSLQSPPSELQPGEASRVNTASLQDDSIVDALLGLDINNPKAESQGSVSSSVCTSSAPECDHRHQDEGQHQQQHESSILQDDDDCLKTQRLIALTEHLNGRHRNAKVLSRRAQDVFLKLYFASNVRLVTAVVIQIKANGFMAYIPSFDLRGPVYLCDQMGGVQVCGGLGLTFGASSIFASGSDFYLSYFFNFNVFFNDYNSVTHSLHGGDLAHSQMDPSLLGLPSTAGEEATGGFLALSPKVTCRLLPGAQISTDPAMKVSICLSVHFRRQLLNSVGGVIPTLAASLFLVVDNW